MIVGIFGNVGGGTSAVAGVVKLLGYKMYGHPKTIDDKALYQTRPFFDLKREGDWAFKHPELTYYIPELVSKFPELKPIYVFRDPVASAWRHNTRDNHPGMLKDAIDYQLQMLDGPEGLYLSYERIIRDRGKAVREIAEYINREPNQAAIDWLDPTLGYRNISDFERK